MTLICLHGVILPEYPGAYDLWLLKRQTTTHSFFTQIPSSQKMNFYDNLLFANFTLTYVQCRVHFDEIMADIHAVFAESSCLKHILTQLHIPHFQLFSFSYQTWRSDKQNVRRQIVTGWCEGLHAQPQRSARNATSSTTLVRLRLVKVGRLCPHFALIEMGNIIK